MRLITWNVQWCRGCDGRVDPARIVRTAREIADFDLLCLQEVAVNFPGLPGSAGEDQVTAIAGFLPAYAPVFGAGVDVRGSDGRRQYFGNVILSRLPVLRAYRHFLPWPADPTATGMQRVAVETVVQAPAGVLRIVNTHLEYYSALQRSAQVERLRELHAEAAGRAVKAGDADERASDGPFAWTPRPRSAILVGDFNFTPDDPLHARLQEPFGGGTPAFRDAWSVAHPRAAHAPTVGLYDKGQWPGAPRTCDFAFVTEDLTARIESVSVNERTRASDHQPVLIELGDG